MYVNLYLFYPRSSTTRKKESNKKFKKNSLDNSNLETYVDNSIHLRCNLHNICRLENYNEKQKFQKLMFPDGITYDRKNDVVRTTKANSIFELMRSLSISFSKNKNGQKNKNVNLSALVSPIGFEPMTKN